MSSDSSVLPLRRSVDVDATPSVLTLDAAGPALDSLASETARSIVDRVFEEPATASDLAEAVGTSLQNVQHHLGRLQEAGLVAAVGTWYSEKGVEMTVYGPAAEPLVICAGAEGNGGGLERALGDAAAAPRAARPGD